MALTTTVVEELDSFLGREYFIPNYQREYAWTNDEWEDFWEDLMQAVNDSSRVHFFGQVVIHDDKIAKKKFIIDGQQRTTTSFIFIKVLQSFYQKIYNDYNLQDAKYNDSFIDIKYIGKEGSFHLTLGENDSEYFRENIQLGIPGEKKEKKKSHENIRKAYYFFKSKVDEKLEKYTEGEDKLDYINSLFNTYKDRFTVLYVVATELEEAFTLFETLNARGKDLETADLLKNFIFSKQTKDITSAQKKWNSMLNKLDKVDPTKFIRHYWNSYKDFTREKELYREINRKLNSPKDSKELLKNLEEYSQCYHDMVVPEDNVGFKNVELIQSLKYLSMLKASSFYPVVLAMIRQKFDEESIAKVVKMIEKYVFRNFTISGKTANKTEVFFAKLARDIYGEALENDKDINKIIKEEMVNDEVFETNFISWVGKKTAKETIRYIYRNIHRYIDTNMELNIDNSEVHIEHIMPENPKQWNVDEETHENYLWRLGNLCLLDGPTNIEISNKPFKEKKDGYGKSKIEPNKELAKLDKWDKKAIEDRQKRLFEYAKEIWS